MHSLDHPYHRDGPGSVLLLCFDVAISAAIFAIIITITPTSRRKMDECQMASADSH